MLDETIAKLESELRAGGLDDEKHAELLRLLSTLRDEVAQMERTDTEQAQSIAAFAHLSTHEATRAGRRPELLEVSLDGLRKSARDLEQAYPRLVETVGALAAALSNLGF